MTRQPYDHPAAIDPHDLLGQCQVTRSRARGPGGQHRNKVQTAVTITHQPTGVAGSASERRSQAQNRSAALFRLRVNLALNVRRPISVDPRTAAASSPSELWRSRCDGRSGRTSDNNRAGRIACNPGHDDFPSMLAEALDVLAAVECDVKSAAALLGCTPSQLVKFIKAEPRALVQVNAARAARGLAALK